MRPVTGGAVAVRPPGTFRDENVSYAHAIRQADGDAELHVWPGAFHGFDSVAPAATLSRAARHARTQWLSRTVERSRR